MTPTADNRRLFTDTRKIIEQNCVIYIGLDALSDSDLAACVGKLLLSDLTATAGDRYLSGNSVKHVSVYVDEASEVMSDGLIQMLNKSRGANFSFTVACQTVADFVAKSGDSSAEAMRILANLNNFIAMRCNDSETQEFLMDRLMKARVLRTSRSHSVSVWANNPAMTGGNIAETEIVEEKDLIPAPFLGMLPNLEFFAIVASGNVVKGRVPVIEIEEVDEEEK